MERWGREREEGVACLTGLTQGQTLTLVILKWVVGWCGVGQEIGEWAGCLFMDWIWFGIYDIKGPVWCCIITRTKFVIL